MRALSLALLALVLSGCDESSGRPSAVGQLSSDRIELRANSAEVVVSRPLEEGAAVPAGQIVAEQDAALAEVAVREASAELAAMQAVLDELANGARPEQLAAARADYDGAREQLTFRSDELARQRRLRERGLNSIGDLDNAEAAWDQASATASAAAARLEELTNGTRVEVLRRAGADVDAAEARVARAVVQRERLRLTAPVAGRLDRYVIEHGERAAAGELIAILLAGEQPLARIYVPAEFRSALSAGDTVRVHVDGVAAPISGTVAWIASDAAFTPYFALNERDRSRLSFLAEIALDFRGDRLADGLPVTVEWDAR